MRCQTGRPAASEPRQPQPERGGEAPDVGRRGVHPQLERVRHRSHGPQRQHELQEHHGRSAKMHPPTPQPLCYEAFPPFNVGLNLQGSGIHRLVWETVPKWECTLLSTSSWTDRCLLCRVPQTTPYSFSTMLLLTGEASMKGMSKFTFKLNGIRFYTT